MLKGGAKNFEPSINHLLLKDETKRQAVAVKQGYETNMIKGVITQFRFLNSEFPDDAEVKSAIGVLRQRLMKRRTLLEDKVRTAVVPIKHTIIIEAAQ